MPVSDHQIMILVSFCETDDPQRQADKYLWAYRLRSIKAFVCYQLSAEVDQRKKHGAERWSHLQFILSTWDEQILNIITS